MEELLKSKSVCCHLVDELASVANGVFLQKHLTVWSAHFSQLFVQVTLRFDDSKSVIQKNGKFRRSAFPLKKTRSHTACKAFIILISDCSKMRFVKATVSNLKYSSTIWFSTDRILKVRTPPTTCSTVY